MAWSSTGAGWSSSTLVSWSTTVGWVRLASVTTVRRAVTPWAWNRKRLVSSPQAKS